MRIFFSVGEPSGDLHGANLITMLAHQRPGLRAVGFGGPRMQMAGMDMLADLTELAVMWFAQAVVNIGKFWQLLHQADEYFRRERPDAVVLIDYPGFNWWIARKAKKHKIPVIYYGAPQMWAWGAWRIEPSPSRPRPAGGTRGFVTLCPTVSTPISRPDMKRLMFAQ